MVLLDSDDKEHITYLSDSQLFSCPFVQGLIGTSHDQYPIKWASLNKYTTIYLNGHTLSEEADNVALGLVAIIIYFL